VDKLWYYTQGASQEKKGPVPEAEIKSLAADGQIRANDLLWTDGMANWAPLSALPQLQSPSPSTAVTPTASPIATLNQMPIPDGLTGWMTFMGVMNIVGGIVSCLTCIGVIWGVFMIIAGTSLLAAKNAIASMTYVPSELSFFFGKLKSFMLMSGIVSIIGAVFAIIQIVLALTGALAALSTMGRHP